MKSLGIVVGTLSGSSASRSSGYVSQAYPVVGS